MRPDRRRLDAEQSRTGGDRSSAAAHSSMPDRGAARLGMSSSRSTDELAEQTVADCVADGHLAVLDTQLFDETVDVILDCVDRDS